MLCGRWVHRPLTAFKPFNRCSPDSHSPYPSRRCWRNMPTKSHNEPARALRLVEAALASLQGALGGGIESFAHGDAFRLVDVPGVPRDVLLTTSRELFEHGLGAEDRRRLHFATFGDPVFEKLLDYMLQPFEAVLAAWQERKPLSALQLGGQRWTTADDLLEGELPESGEIELVPRAQRLPGRQDDRVGRQQKVMLDAAAASLAEQKLKPTPDTPNNQIAELDRFRGDVSHRHGQRVHLKFDAPDRNGMLALKDTLLWPVREKAAGLQVDADPLLLTATRDVIYRQLGDMKKDSRTGHEVAVVA